MITRYDHTGDDPMEPHPRGEWIRFSDVLAERALHNDQRRLLIEENKGLKELILVLRGFRGYGLCPRCRAPTPCHCGHQPTGI